MNVVERLHVPCKARWYCNDCFMESYDVCMYDGGVSKIFTDHVRNPHEAFTVYYCACKACWHL